MVLYNAKEKKYVITNVVCNFIDCWSWLFWTLQKIRRENKSNSYNSRCCSLHLCCVWSVHNIFVREYTKEEEEKRNEGYI